ISYDLVQLWTMDPNSISDPVARQIFITEKQQLVQRYTDITADFLNVHDFMPNDHSTALVSAVANIGNLFISPNNNTSIIYATIPAVLLKLDAQTTTSFHYNIYGVKRNGQFEYMAVALPEKLDLDKPTTTSQATGRFTLNTVLKDMM